MTKWRVASRVALIAAFTPSLCSFKAWPIIFWPVFWLQFLRSAILAFYAWPVAIALFLLFPFYVLLTRRSSSKWQATQMGINRDTDINVGRFVESVNQIRVVKSFAREASESLFFAGKRRSIETQTRSQSMQWHKIDIARRSGLAAIFFFIYAYVVIQTYQRQVHAGRTYADVAACYPSTIPAVGSFICCGPVAACPSWQQRLL